MKIKDLNECVDINEVVDADFYVKMKGDNGLYELVFVKFVEDYDDLKSGDVVLVLQSLDDIELLSLKKVTRFGNIFRLRDLKDLKNKIMLSDNIEIVGKANYKLCEMI